jgi:Eukaryotic translation initiation factor 3 subunit 7 (eIF-3)
MRPTDFAAQLNVSLANGWGIVRTVTDLCLKMPEGKYVLVKDPNKVMSIACRERAIFLCTIDSDNSLITARDPSLLRSISCVHE